MNSRSSTRKGLRRGGPLALTAALLALAPNLACDLVGGNNNASTAAAPAVQVRINAGTWTQVTTTAGTTFSADRNYVAGHNSGDITKSISGTTDPSLYYSHRWGMKGYDIPVAAKGTYTVKLHFAETAFNARGKRVFDVSAERALKVNDLDVFAEAGARRALVKTFNVDVTDGTLNLAFGKVVEDPMVSAIEVTGPTTRGNTDIASPIPTPNNVAPKPTTPTTTPTTTAPTTTTTTTAPTTTTTTTAPTTPNVTAPTSSAFPNASNTGPSGSLKASGSITTTSNGQVIQNLDISGEVRVQHNNVTIRNVRIRSNGGNAIYILNNTGLVIEDCLLDGQGKNAEPAVAHHNYTMRRCEVVGFGEGPRTNSNVTLEDNYIHGFANYVPQGAHLDGTQGIGGSNVTIRHNTVLVEPDGANAGIFFSTSSGSNILIENNLVGGGNWAIWLDTIYSNVTIRNNAFTTTIPYHSKGGYFAPIAPYRGSNWTISGNYWHDGPNAGKAAS